MYINNAGNNADSADCILSREKTDFLLLSLDTSSLTPFDRSHRDEPMVSILRVQLLFHGAEKRQNTSNFWKSESCLGTYQICQDHLDKELEEQLIAHVASFKMTYSAPSFIWVAMRKMGLPSVKSEK